MGISYFKFSFFILQVPAITIQCPVLWGRKVWHTIIAFNALLVLTSITRTLLLPDCLVFDWVRSRWSTMVVSVFTKSLTSYVRRAICIYYPFFYYYIKHLRQAQVIRCLRVVSVFVPIRAVLQFAFACFGWWNVECGFRRRQRQ